jgi:hypothetical protein
VNLPPNRYILDNFGIQWKASGCIHVLDAFETAVSRRKTAQERNKGFCASGHGYVTLIIMLMHRRNGCTFGASGRPPVTNLERLKRFKYKEAYNVVGKLGGARNLLRSAI